MILLGRPDQFLYSGRQILPSKIPGCPGQDIHRRIVLSSTRTQTQTVLTAHIGHMSVWRCTASRCSSTSTIDTKTTQYENSYCVTTRITSSLSVEDEGSVTHTGPEWMCVSVTVSDLCQFSEVISWGSRIEVC